MKTNTHDSDRTDNRRSFLKAAALTGAAAVTGAAGTAEAAPAWDRKLKIGAMCVGTYSFMSFSWSDIIEPDKGANNPKNQTFGTPFLNMDITHVWDVDFAAAEKFAARMGATAVRRYDEMAGKVDGVIQGGYYEVPWQHKLAHPYIEAGTPIYLSRPFAYSLRDVDELLDLAAKHGTPIMATAKFEHYVEAPALKKKLEKIGRILCVQATCNTPDYPVHFHLLYMMLKVLGYDIGKVSVIADDHMKANYMQVTYVFKGWENQPPFSCVMQGCRNDDSFTVTIYGTNGTAEARMVRSPDWQEGLLFRYAPQVIDMQRTFMGKNYEPLDNIRKKTAAFLAGYKSYLEHAGGMVDVDSLPVDWTAPYPQPGWIDESMFKR